MENTKNKISRKKPKKIQKNSDFGLTAPKNLAERNNFIKEASERFVKTFRAIFCLFLSDGDLNEDFLRTVLELLKNV